MQKTINLSEELHAGLQIHQRMLKCVVNQLGHIEDDLSKFEEMSYEEYSKMEKSDLYLHVQEINQILPLLMEVLNSQMKSLNNHTDKANGLYEQLKLNESIKKDQ